jgi:hypothetical protein
MVEVGSESRAKPPHSASRNYAFRFTQLRLLGQLTLS